MSGVHYFYYQDETIVLYLAEISSDLSLSGGPGLLESSAGRSLPEARKHGSVDNAIENK